MKRVAAAREPPSPGRGPSISLNDDAPSKQLESIDHAPPIPVRTDLPLKNTLSKGAAPVYTSASALELNSWNPRGQENRESTENVDGSINWIRPDSTATARTRSNERSFSPSRDLAGRDRHGTLTQQRDTRCRPHTSGHLSRGVNIPRLSLPTHSGADSESESPRDPYDDDNKEHCEPAEYEHEVRRLECGAGGCIFRTLVL